MIPEIVAEFAESDHALRFAKMLGADYTLCDGTRANWWGVRPKTRRECGLGDPFNPPDSYIEQESYDGFEDSPRV